MAERFIFFECDLGLNRSMEILNSEYSDYHIVPGTVKIGLYNGDPKLFQCLLEKDQKIIVDIPGYVATGGI